MGRSGAEADDLRNAPWGPGASGGSITAGLSVLGFCEIGCPGYREGARKREDRPTPGGSGARRRRGTEYEAAGVQRSMRAGVQGRGIKDER